MKKVNICCFVSLLHVVISFGLHNSYKLDVTDVGREFDGIGGISGGGATSKLLINYPEPQRSQLLDYLFLPNFGASLHILKVEIGGDSQSTDGSESSHMHSETDENYERGYEWWLMKEAKKRNPHIKLYGLPWVFPGWLGGGIFNPYSNRTNLAKYFVNWVKGADEVHGLQIDYLGIWNERPYDIKFFSMLREGLDTAGYQHIKIVGGDSASWDIAKDYMSNPSLHSAMDIIGIHYPGITKYLAPKDALDSKLPLWASEEYSAFNDWKGGACWARILTSGYVYGNFSAFIAWNLIAGYYNHLPYSRSSLMTANEPWSGHYDVNFPIWTAAHHTQFTKPGWMYLKHGQGSGFLKGNGTYVSLTDPDKMELTIVVETFDPADVGCFYPMPKYTIAANQTATFKLPSTLHRITKLNVWFSNKSVQFKQLKSIDVVDGQFTVLFRKNEYYTFTTLSNGKKGSHPPPPASRSFIVPYADDFEGYKLCENANNIAQQSASFEIIDSGDESHGKVLAQVVNQPPVDTCRPDHMSRPIAHIGDFGWADVLVNVDVYIPALPLGASGVFLAARVDIGGCWAMYSNGLYLWLMPSSGTVLLTGNYTQSIVYYKQNLQLDFDHWYTMQLHVKGNTVSGYLDTATLFNVTLPVMPSTNGFISLGTANFGHGYFDNFAIKTAEVSSHPSNDRARLANNIQEQLRLQVNAF